MLSLTNICMITLRSVGNSTLGFLLYWWHSSRQQSSKARMTIRSAETLPVLDFRCLTEEQLGKAEAIFEEFRDKELKRLIWRMLTPTALCWTGGWCATCWGSTRRSTQGCGGWRRSGARSLRCTGARRGRRGRGWWFRGDRSREFGYKLRIS